MQEQQLRDEIRKNLIEHLFYDPTIITERHAISMQPGEFSQIFFEPWKNVLKGAFVDLKKIASQVITTVRLLFTLNQKKAKEIVARQKDRMRKFDKESDDIFQKLGGEKTLGDFYTLSFLANPGGFLAGKLASSSPEMARSAINVAKEIGLGDKSIKTVTGDEGEEDALVRRRDQDGPVTKALRAIEQIFFLAHAKNDGNLIFEAADNSNLTSEILSGPLGAQVAEAREAMFDSARELINIVVSINAQNDFMASTAQKNNADKPKDGLRQMTQALDALKRIDPESAEAFGDLPKRITDEASAMADNEEFQKTEKARLGDDTEIDFESQALKAVMGATFNDTVEPYTDAINENKMIMEDLLFGLFPEEILTSGFVESVNSEVDGFSDALKKAELVLQRKIIS